MLLRVDLQLLLEGILGSENVYFQPPPTFKMLYPCIVYNISDIESTHANNKPYIFEKKYTLTVIDRDPDSDTPLKIAELPMCTFDRHFTSNNLNHDVFNIYY